MSESNLEKNAQPAPSAPASSPDELIKDLDVTLSETDQESVVGGYLYKTIKLTNDILSK